MAPSSSSKPPADSKATATATAAASGQQKEEKEKDSQPYLGVLEEDDEFEEFETAGMCFYAVYFRISGRGEGKGRGEWIIVLR